MYVIQTTNINANSMKINGEWRSVLINKNIVAKKNEPDGCKVKSTFKWELNK